jgi:glycosyltransferase involved in cell wall biosynthesis
MISAIATRAALPRNSKVEVRRPRRVNDRNPSVSVVIPCYNYGHYLSACVRSVLDQPGVDVDVLILDDASPDGSADIVRQLVEQDKRVRAIYHEKNRGHIATYNEGLDQATGDYAVMLSADDQLTPGALARATTLMDQCPSVGMVHGVAADFTHTHLPAARTDVKSWVIWPGQEWISGRCRSGHNVVRSPEVVMRTSVLREVGAYRADLPHTADFELWMRFATVSGIGFIVGVDQAYYRLHENNMHHTKFNLAADIAGRLQAFDAVFAERRAFLPDADEMRDTAHRTMAREALRHAISAYTRGVAAEQSVAEYVELALDTWPGVKDSADWRLLDKLKNGQGGDPRRSLRLRLREKARNLEYALNWRRSRWAGVY